MCIRDSTYPKKTDKSVGVGEVNVPIEINNMLINPDEWIYVDTNGWVITKSELEL